MNVEQTVLSPLVDVQETPVIKKKSNGQLFKEKYGISKSMKRNMRKKGLISSLETINPKNIQSILTVYKQYRKETFKLRSKAIRNKHEMAKAGRRTGPRTKVSKGKKQDSTKEKTK